MSTPDDPPMLFAIEATPAPQIVSATAVPAKRAKTPSITLDDTPTEIVEPPKPKKREADEALIGTWGRVNGWNQMHFVIGVDGGYLTLACIEQIHANLWTAKARPGITRCSTCHQASTK